MSTQTEMDIVTVDSSVDNNNYLSNARDEIDGELTHSSVKDMVDKVLAKVGTNCIKTLQIVGHGQPGELVVGAGRTAGVAGKRINGNKAEWESELKRLKGKFCAGAKVSLLGCNTGVCATGFDKLVDLADFWGVKVCGTTRTIYGRADFDDDGFDGDAGDLVDADPGDNKGCRVQPDGSRVKKLKKLKNVAPGYVTGFSPSDIMAMGVQKPSELPNPVQINPFTDPLVIQQFFNSIDWSQAYDGNGLGAVLDAEVTLVTSAMITAIWGISLQHYALEVPLDGEIVIYEVADPGAFQAFLDSLMVQQTATNIQYRTNFGYSTPKEGFKGQPIKEMRPIVFANIDKPQQGMSAKELLESPVTVIRGIGPGIADTFANALDIRTVGDLARLNQKSRWTTIAKYVQMLADMEK